MLVGRELLEVLLEGSRQCASLLVPLSHIGVGVARIENLGLAAGQFCRNLQVEVRNCRGRNLVDRAVENGVDNRAGILNGNTLACSVPARVHEVNLRADHVDFANEFFGVLDGVQRQEGRTEAGRAGRRRPDTGRTKRRCKRAAPTQAKRPETGRTGPERTRAATAKRRRTSVRKPRTGPPQAAPPQTQRPEIRRAALLKSKVSQQKESVPEKEKHPGAGKRP